MLPTAALCKGYMVKVLVSVCLFKMRKTLEEEWKSALNAILQELNQEQYDTLLDLLSQIRQNQKAGKPREQMPQIIIEHYGLHESYSVIKEEMWKMPRRDSKVQDLLRPFEDKLKNNHEKERDCEFIQFYSFSYLVKEVLICVGLMINV